MAPKAERLYSSFFLEVLRPSDGHPRRCRVPHQADFVRGQAVDLVDHVVQSVFQLHRLCRQQPCRVNRAGIFVPEVWKASAVSGFLLLRAFWTSVTNASESRETESLSLLFGSAIPC